MHSQRLLRVEQLPLEQRDQLLATAGQQRVLPQLQQRDDAHAASPSGLRAGSCSGSRVTCACLGVPVITSAKAAASAAAIAPAAASRKKWLPVPTITRSTNGG